MSGHTETLCRRLAFAAFYYRALHSVKRGIGFQDLIRLLDFGLFYLTYVKISDIHCMGRRH